MGLFSSLINPVGSAFGGSSTINNLADPMDLSGNNARLNQERMNNELQRSADASMRELQDTYNRIKQLYAPLEDAGRQGIEQLNASGFQPSNTYRQTLATGERDLGRKLRAMGRLNSTFGSRQMSDFYTRAAQEEVDRQYAPTLSLMQMGSGAVNAITGAGTAFGGATDRTLGNLGQGLFSSAQNYGAQRQDSANSAANTLGSMAQYFNMK